MHTSVIAIFALLLAVAAFNLGLGLQATLLGVRAGLEGFDLNAVGIVMSANYLGFILGSLLSPKIVARVGHIRAFAVMAVMASSVTVLHAMFLAPGPWIVLRAITGFSYAGLCMVAESWLNQRAVNADRGIMLSLYMGATLAASAAGQLLLNIWPPTGFEPFILVSIILSLSLVPVALSTSPAPPLSPSPPMPIRALFRASPVGVVGCFVTGLLYSAIGGLGAVFAQSIGLSIFEISIFMMLIVVGGTAALWPFGWLSDRIDRRAVVAGLSLAVAITGGAIIVAVSASGSTLLLFVLATLYGAAAMPIYGVAVAHANDKLAHDQYVSASSTLLLCYGIGAVFGPVSASQAMVWLGPAGLFTFIATIGAVAALFVLLRKIQRPATSDAGKGVFVATPVTTPAALGLAPLANEGDPGEAEGRR